MTLDLGSGISVVMLVLPVLGGLLPAVAQDWRWILLGVALAEAGAGVLLLRLWPPFMALSLLIAGWIAAAFLGLGQSAQWQRGAPMPEAWAGRLFRFTITGFALVLLAYQTENTLAWLPRGFTPEMAWAALGLMLTGILHLAMTQHPFRATASLLILLAGFVLVYAYIEQSLLLTVLLVGVKLFLGAMGSYLLFAPVAGEGA